MVAELDLAPARDPGQSDHKDVWVADQVFHPAAMVRFPVLVSLYLPLVIVAGRVSAPVLCPKGLIVTPQSAKDSL